MPDSPDPPQPDLLLVGRAPGRMFDWGPRYQETPSDPLAPNAPRPAEPWNSATATLFILIVVIWVWRLRGHYRRHPFVVGCLPILLAGGVGGTLYHATRSSRAYFLLDVIPISLLGLAGSVFLAWWLGRVYGKARIAAMALGLTAVYLAVNFAIRLIPNPPANLAINLSYASLAAVILVPLVAVLARTRFRHGGLVLGALASFGIAWFCRLIDNTPLGGLPMGTHWLWHSFGALTTALVMEYFTRLEAEEN